MGADGVCYWMPSEVGMRVDLRLITTSPWPAASTPFTYCFRWESGYIMASVSRVNPRTDYLTTACWGNRLTNHTEYCSTGIGLKHFAEYAPSSCLRVSLEDALTITKIR